MKKLPSLLFFACIAAITVSCIQKPALPLDKQGGLSKQEKALQEISGCLETKAENTEDGKIRCGEYLALAGDCGACHTAEHGGLFSGGKSFTIPVGKVFATNISPDSSTGIGNYSLNDFEKALRTGIAKDGHYLYPAMPYTSYSLVSYEDISLLYAYFTKGVTPQKNPNFKAHLHFPLGVRRFMSVWNALFFKKGEYAFDFKKNALWNRGAYLVQGLAHCGECHTPRGIASHVKARKESDNRTYLSGATIDNWRAPALTGDSATGLGAWSNVDIAQYLKTGSAGWATAAGPMAEVIAKSTYFLTDYDRMAIAEYLKSL